MIRKQLTEFLVKAKKNTYAKAGRNLETTLGDGSKELIYEEDYMGVYGKVRYKYEDNYHGSNPFMGREIVFVNGRPIWGMIYRGRCINTDNKRVYDFLKRSLRTVGKNKPFRGPDRFVDSRFENGNYKYLNSVSGSLGEFKGEERIFFKGQLVYVCNYHGGFI